MNKLQRWMFVRLWAKNTPFCKTCGQPEGGCFVLECNRLAFTNRFLFTGEHGAVQPSRSQFKRMFA